MSESSSFFTREEEHRIISSIRNAEELTSGEIRVHVSQSPDSGDSMEETQRLFGEMRMYNTVNRNAVLIHISVASRSFALLGDEGIDKVVPENFWESTKNLMKDYFSQENIVEGICAGVRNIGVHLKEHFPIEEGDIDELPNEISYD